MPVLHKTRLAQLFSFRTFTAQHWVLLLLFSSSSLINKSIPRHLQYRRERGVSLYSITRRVKYSKQSADCSGFAWANRERVGSDGRPAGHCMHTSIYGVACALCTSVGAVGISPSGRSAPHSYVRPLTITRVNNLYVSSDY